MDRQSRSERVPVTEEKQKAFGIVGYIEKFVIANNVGDEAAEKDITSSFETTPPEEKAMTLFHHLISYGIEYKANRKSEPRPRRLEYIADPYLISEIKVLWSDPATRKTFLKTYGDALLEAKTFSVSALGRELRLKELQIQKLEEEYRTLKQSLVLQTVSRPTQKAAVESKLERVAKDLTRARSGKEKIIKLDGHEHTEANTDVAAKVMFDSLARYHDQAENGFAWLPSRLALHQKILDLMENTGKAPLLIGPPGTGKTSQLDAVATELTGEPSVRIPCNSSLGDEGLIAKRDFRSGEGAYDYTGCIAEAYTGFEHSNDLDQKGKHGRVVNLDEISQLNLEKALGPLKDVRLAKPGKPLNRYVQQKVLPGASLAATSNLPITDERLDREFGRIPTNYFEMRSENPELYEFMLAKLINDDRTFPTIDRAELSPAYTENPVTDGPKLADGSQVIGEEKLVADTTLVSHGFLYRLSYSIRTLQDSYIHGSKFNEKHLANTALFSDLDDKGNIVITGYSPDFTADPTGSSAGGEMLKLTAGSSTLTPEIISRWLDAFKTRMRSKNADDHVKTLTEWLQIQLQNHIDQTSPEDGEKIKAICNYWHLFDPVSPSLHPSLLTPKDVGYLSPRVPRPLQVEKPEPVKRNEEEFRALTHKDVPAAVYMTTEVLLENGERILIRKATYHGATQLSDDFTLNEGKRFRINNVDYSFRGESDEMSDGTQLAGESKKEKGLHTLFDKNEIELGILEFDLAKLEKGVNSLCRREKQKAD